MTLTDCFYSYFHHCSTGNKITLCFHMELTSDLVSTCSGSRNTDRRDSWPGGSCGNQMATETPLYKSQQKKINYTENVSSEMLFYVALPCSRGFLSFKMNVTFTGIVALKKRMTGSEFWLWSTGNWCLINPGAQRGRPAGREIQFLVVRKSSNDPKRIKPAKIIMFELFALDDLCVFISSSSF